ncbi:MAG: septal ring lytic transglycosylase RlpA family protein [Rhodospirillales bacterium]
MRNAETKFRPLHAGGLAAAVALAALAAGCMAPPEPVQPVALAVPAPPPEPPKPKGQVGTASWYGPGFTGKKTANGEIFDDAQMTAAHKTLPFDTDVKVTNLETGKSVRVRINDRGPHVKGRLIDLSRKAAEALDITDDGVARVRVEEVGASGRVAANEP